MHAWHARHASSTLKLLHLIATETRGKHYHFPPDMFICNVHTTTIYLVERRGHQKVLTHELADYSVLGTKLRQVLHTLKYLTEFGYQVVGENVYSYRTKYT